MPCISTKLASYLPFRHFQLCCQSHFQLHQIFKMMFFSSSFPVFLKHFTQFLKIRERGSKILKTVINLSYANIHIVILLLLCCNILYWFILFDRLLEKFSPGQHLLMYNTVLSRKRSVCVKIYVFAVTFSSTSCSWIPLAMISNLNIWSSSK